MARNTAGYGLTALRIFLGVFFLFEGLGKWQWIADSGPLVSQLSGWAEQAPASSRWYLDAIAIPFAPVFARLVMLGEITLGFALAAGFRVRLAAILGFLMVLNFHFASGRLFQYAFLTNGYGLPVLGGLLALAIGGAKLPWNLRG